MWLIATNYQCVAHPNNPACGSNTTAASVVAIVIVAVIVAIVIFDLVSKLSRGLRTPHTPALRNRASRLAPRITLTGQAITLLTSSKSHQPAARWSRRSERPWSVRVRRSLTGTVGLLGRCGW